MWDNVESSTQVLLYEAGNCEGVALYATHPVNSTGSFQLKTPKKPHGVKVLSFMLDEYGMHPSRSVLETELMNGSMPECDRYTPPPNSTDDGAASANWFEPLSEEASSTG